MYTNRSKIVLHFYILYTIDNDHYSKYNLIILLLIDWYRNFEKKLQILDTNKSNKYNTIRYVRILTIHMSQLSQTSCLNTDTDGDEDDNNGSNQMTKQTIQ